jgi:3-deoxy-D-manno-octulosonic-acid transferase
MMINKQKEYMLLLLYNVAWIFLFPVMSMLLVIRIIIGKEDIMRIKERFGIASSVRTNKNIIWIHAASVGESRIALTLTKHLHKIYPKHRVLITTGTITSSGIVRTFASANIVHQFLPMDNPISVLLFFRYWKPDMGIFIESELWPNLINIGACFCPLLLVNARMSHRSFKKWSKYKFAAQMMISKFKYVLCQSAIDAEKYKVIGADAVHVGNLKYSSNRLDVNPAHLKALEAMIGQRPVFFAASTHPGDDEIILDAHLECKKQYPDILTIIAPRHIIRAQDIKNIILNSGLSCSIRSCKENITQYTDIYIADTIGELGTFFSIADATCICGSFSDGGHNPIEAGYFDTHIIFGPDMRNFVEIADEFLQYKAATQIQDTKSLAKILENIFSGKVASSKEAAVAILQNHANVMFKYMNYVKKCLVPSKK